MQFLGNEENESEEDKEWECTEDAWFYCNRVNPEWIL
jgi:hypothetical protein